MLNVGVEYRIIISAIQNDKNDAEPEYCKHTLKKRKKKELAQILSQGMKLAPKPHRSWGLRS